MMLYGSLLTIALAGAASAFTPAGFAPASSNNLTVAFGNTLAVNGVDLPKAKTASAPTIATTERLSGTYTIMMVDPDIPPRTAGGATTELLHWMQSGLVSSNTSTMIGGMKVFELINPSNTAPIASYIQPSPPNKSPSSHRYTQLLLNTTGNGSALSTLATFGKTRTNFSAVDAVNSSGLTVLKGNSFNVTAATNTTSSGGSSSGNSTNSTTGTTSAAGTKATTTNSGAAESTVTSTSLVGAVSTSGAGDSTPTSSAGAVAATNAAEPLRRDGAMVAGLGAFAALMILL